MYKVAHSIKSKFEKEVLHNLLYVSVQDTLYFNSNNKIHLYIHLQNVLAVHYDLHVHVRDKIKMMKAYLCDKPITGKQRNSCIYVAAN